MTKRLLKVYEGLAISLKRNSTIFSETRRNLAQYNSKMLIVFLLIINLTIGVLLFVNMYQEQRMEMIDITNQQINALKLDPDGSFGNKKDIDNKINLTKGIFLTYFIRRDGQLEMIDDFSPEIHTSIDKKIGNWRPEDLSEKLIEINLTKNQPTYLLMAAQNIYVKGKRVGTIYIGKDIKLLRDLYIRFLILLAGFSIVFFVIAVVIGRFMTKRAMKPIIKSYSVQTEFIADASHELRTPLSVLKSGIEAIEFEERHKLSSFSSMTLKDLKDELTSTTNLVNNLLYLIRSDSGQQRSLHTEFDLYELVNQTKRSFGHQAESKGIELGALNSKPLLVYSDQDKIKQLLYLLVDNAIKYTPEGGKVDLNYGLSLSSSKKAFYIAVKDNGIGIPMKDQARIFDRFYRVDKSRSRENGSSGLGLSIGKSITESLNGSLSVSSQENEGCEFILTIPYSKDRSNVRQEES